MPTHLLRVRRARRLLISTRSRARQATCAASLHVRIPRVFWSNAAAVVPRMLPYLIMQARAEVNPSRLARRLGAMSVTFARAAPSLLRVAYAAQFWQSVFDSVPSTTPRAAVVQRGCDGTARDHGAGVLQVQAAATPRVMYSVSAAGVVACVCHQRCCERCALAGGQRQRASSRAWRGYARRDVAARHNNVRILACVGCHVWACIL